MGCSLGRQVAVFVWGWFIVTPSEHDPPYYTEEIGEGHHRWTQEYDMYKELEEYIQNGLSLSSFLELKVWSWPFSRALRQITFLWKYQISARKRFLLSLLSAKCRIESLKSVTLLFSGSIEGDTVPSHIWVSQLSATEIFPSLLFETHHGNCTPRCRTIVHIFGTFRCYGC